LNKELESKIPNVQNESFANQIISLSQQLEGKASNGDPETGKLLLNFGLFLTCFSNYFEVKDIFNKQMTSKPSEEVEN
jgi:hypothetical protein